MLAQLGFLLLLSASLLACSGASEIGALDRASGASAINDEPLPLGLPLPETRESCEVAPGLWLTRIVRGTPVRVSEPLPCEGIDTTTNFGGGDPTALVAIGPWVVHVLEFDPDAFNGTMQPALAAGAVARKATVAEMAAAHGAIAGVNAGFFVVGTQDDELSGDGITGEPAGVTVVDGELLSEAIRGRTTLTWNTADAHSLRFPSVATELSARSGSQELVLDGINRAPGLIRNCGGTDDEPGDQPRHDVTCTDADELIWYTDAFGRDTLGGEGLEAVIDAAGRIRELRVPGGAIPSGGAVLAATGNAVAQLQALAVGEALSLDAAVIADGLRIASPDLAMLNAGPRLLRDGSADLTDVEGGFQHPGDPTFGAAWVSSPQPRSFVGRMASGRVLFVVVDGRQPDWSVGVALEDAVELMAHLGAVDAMNLDGGGSSTLVVNGLVVNQPSDGSPRAVSDAVVFVGH